MKKILSIILCLVMVMSLLSGCSKDKTSDDTNDVAGGTSDTTNTGDNTATATPAEDQPVTITIGISPSDSATDADIERWNTAVATMKEKHPNVTVKEAHYDYAPDTFVALAEAGNLPTLYGTWFTEPQKLINQGYAADITSELQARNWIDPMNKSLLSILSDKDGKVYGVPVTAYGLGLMINVDMFKAAGLVDGEGVPIFPKTWQEVAEDAKKIKDATGEAGLVILAQDGGGGWHFSNIAWSFGATLTIENADDTYTANLDSPEAIQAMEFVKSLKWDYDVLTADPTTENWGTGFTNLGAGTAAMYIAANDAIGMPINNGLELGHLAICAFPAGPNGDQYSLAGGNAYMFSPDATEAEINAALDFTEIYGYGPSTDSLAGYESSIKGNKEAGRPVVKPFPIWTNEDLISGQNAIIEKYNDGVNPKMYSNYFDIVTKEGNLHTEDKGSVQDMYAELTKVLQAVLTDKNADVAALMKTADQNYQKILDDLK
jgi:multiple sugar transport system substrate-binding protein